MPKRKRDGVENVDAESSGEEQGKSMRQRRAAHKLGQGYKLVNKAFKTAKGFERQKLGRRRKAACEKGDTKDVERIDAETEALKTLDFASAARNYLHKSLLKFKAVAESPDLPKIVLKPAAPMPNSETANVIARLCNSNPAKEALPSILKDIQQSLGIKVSDDALKPKKRLRAKDFDEAQGQAAKAGKKQKQDHEMSGLSDIDSEDESGQVAVMQRRAHSDNEDDISADEADQDQDLDAGADYDSEDFSKFDSRIATSSDQDDDSDDETGNKDTSSRSRAAKLSPSDSPEPRRQSGLSSKPTKSAFIPSLSMGGYWSGSESEPEDDIDVAPRKNRRGQRARQAIAEKKFGKNAKHLQKQAAMGKNDRNQGWDAKRGAVDRAGPRGRGGPQKFGRSAPNMNGVRDASKPPPKKHRDDSGPLHPSWEAAKKAKDAKVTATFQGKKVTFD